MYQALYRKYRPRRFSDVAGQEHITETLRRQIVSGRLSHAYLFVGTRGTGKTTCAKILSRAVNCQNHEDGEPCNKCMSCIGIEDGSILDVLELDAASNNSVDNVRALRDEAIYSPATVKKRVYIVDEVHMLSLSAFNALLKILEEPPEHILFVLATTELHKVPATIQSRCQKFSFKRLSPTALADRLNRIASGEGLTLTADAAKKLASLADGSMRDGISLLDQCASDELVDSARVLDTLGLAGQQELSRLADSVAGRDVLSALSILDELYDDGRDMASLMGEMAVLFRDVLVYKLSPDSGLLSADYDSEVLSTLSQKLTPERLFYCLDVLKAAISIQPRGGSSKLSVEMCLIRMCNEQLSDDAGALLSRISRLETDGVASTASVNLVGVASVTDEPAVSHVEVVASEIDPVVTDSVADSSVEIASVADESAVVSHVEAAANVSGGLWSDTLDILRSDPPVHALLSDSSKVQARREDDTLIISVTDSFTASLIESEFSQPLKDAACKVLGRSVSIRVVAGSSDTEESKRSKLENLSAYGIVNFE